MTAQRIAPYAAAVLCVIAAATALILPIAACGAALLGAVALGYGQVTGRTREVDPALLEKVATQVDHGRRLAIYERDTSLLAHWYVVLRAEEECARAVRYARELTLLLIEPQAGSEEWVTQEKLADWLHRSTRHSDLAGYLGNGRFIVLLAETGGGGTATFVRRMTGKVAQVDVGIGACPDDGQSYKELLAKAEERLRSAGAGEREEATPQAA